ncbi:CRISPR-associated helicase Cas3' [Sphaerisporangium aureirubrum]|uniref:CRISPR-associated helicase Cas3 n=1 Tax=Sphaerisporangium aureirubrum TaxID=1544736 RepID=A0ABW1NFK0_9ACTN
MSEGASRDARFVDGLSDAARSVWAKHDRDTDGWLPLWRHLADSAAVVGLLWDCWVPEHVKALIAGKLPGGGEDARRLMVWLAITHDVGKATPAFACQVESLAEAMRAAGLDMPHFKRLVDRKLAPHGLAGQVLLQEWLAERYGWTKANSPQFCVIAGGHHGVPPTFSDIHEVNGHSELLRTPGCASIWRGVQWEFLDRCAEMTGVKDRLGEWQAVRLSQPVQVLLTGLVIVADWIASNSDLFPYFSEAQKSSDEERVEAAWRGLGLPAPWSASAPEGDAAEFFSARFELPPGARVRPVQERAVAMARASVGAGLMVIEAPMGEGKTEAALAVAEIFATRVGAGGCFVALPTMATGNAMFPRLLDWLRRMPDEQVGQGPRSVLLAHSKAALNKDFAGLMRAGARAVRGVEQDGGGDEWGHRADRQCVSAELIAHQWLRGKKKAMLASFVVGTIDQLLFMGLKSRHLALRHLALAGKVVVIDEAHAYDTYMNAYLDMVLSWLGHYRVPVVVLSATLPARRRRELAEAYAGGADFAEVEKADGYPLLTVVEPGRQPVIETVGPSGREVHVHLERLGDELSELGNRLDEEMADGGCALVVRNTVDRVLETAEYLRERFGAKQVSVAHARFLDLDRAEKDADLLKRFGPTGKSTGDRPTNRHIVVASQVAEQSLDIDFDILVSDLCPIDLLLQRVGRLHRHRRGEGECERPLRLRTARCLVTGADWQTVPVEPVRGSQRVYRRYPLLRSAAALEPYLSGTAETGHVVRLPQDISPLVQLAYGDERIGPQEWHEAMDLARAGQESHHAAQTEKAERFRLNGVGKAGRALIGWVDAGVGDADDTRKGRAQVRDSQESLEVLVVQRRVDGTLRTLPHLTEGRGALELPTESAPDHRLARIVAASGLRLPYHFSIPQVMDRAIEELEADCVPAWQSKESHWLAGELILMLDEDCRTQLAGYNLHYTPDDGLKVTSAE